MGRGQLLRVPSRRELRVRASAIRLFRPERQPFRYPPWADVRLAGSARMRGAWEVTPNLGPGSQSSSDPMSDVAIKIGAFLSLARFVDSSGRTARCSFHKGISDHVSRLGKPNHRRFLRRARHEQCDRRCRRRTNQGLAEPAVECRACLSPLTPLARPRTRGAQFHPRQAPRG